MGYCGIHGHFVSSTAPGCPSCNTGQWISMDPVPQLPHPNRETALAEFRAWLVNSKQESMGAPPSFSALWQALAEFDRLFPDLKW